MKILANIAETGLGSYVSPAIMGLFVGTPPLPAMLRIALQAGRWRDVFYFSTASQLQGGMPFVAPLDLP